MNKDVVEYRRGNYFFCESIDRDVIRALDGLGKASILSGNIDFNLKLSKSKKTLTVLVCPLGENSKFEFDKINDPVEGKKYSHQINGIHYNLSFDYSKINGEK